MPCHHLLLRVSPLLALLLAACATEAPPDSTAAVAAPPVPAALNVGTGVTHLRTVAARGVQIYECRAVHVGAAPQWVFVAPDAQLFDGRGAWIGTHGAGTQWTAADGSAVVGRVTARAEAPDAGAIAWLLLATTHRGPRGAFSDVTAIQRVATRGGLAPLHGCNAGALGRRVEVPYTADYRLFGI